jgi:hypothetical protein
LMIVEDLHWADPQVLGQLPHSPRQWLTAPVSW